MPRKSLIHSLAPRAFASPIACIFAMEPALFGSPSQSTPSSSRFTLPCSPMCLHAALMSSFVTSTYTLSLRLAGRSFATSLFKRRIITFRSSTWYSANRLPPRTLWCPNLF